MEEYGRPFPRTVVPLTHRQRPAKGQSAHECQEKTLQHAPWPGDKKVRLCTGVTVFPYNSYVGILTPTSHNVTLRGNRVPADIIR